jgi:hypothetical protein
LQAACCRTTNCLLECAPNFRIPQHCQSLFPPDAWSRGSKDLMWLGQIMQDQGDLQSCAGRTQAGIGHGL